MAVTSRRMIMTVTGSVSALGFTHAHEHLSIEKGRSSEVNPALQIDNMSLTLMELYTYRHVGGESIVDAQPPGCGRNASALVHLSRKSGVLIVASTGFHKQLFYPENHWLFNTTEEDLAGIFIHELQTGMYIDCDNHPPVRHIPHRAGVIKTALDGGSGLSSHEQRVFSAAAAAGIACGAPLLIHVEKGSDPVTLADFCQTKGLATSRMIFCHMDRMVPDLEVHKRLCARGAYLEYDTIARPKYHSDLQEAEIIRAMTDAGFASQILLGLDVTRERLKSYGGSVGLCYLAETFVPLLRKGGIDETAIDLMLRRNADHALASAYTSRGTDSQKSFHTCW